MQLVIDCSSHTLLPIKQYREQWSLPENFSVALFEPKDYTGLARINDAGAEMQSLRDAVLNDLPKQIGVADALNQVDRLIQVFDQHLTLINPTVQLKQVEIDFAVAGFGDMTRAWLYAIIPAVTSQQDKPSFTQVYSDWLTQSIRVSSQVHEYPYHQDTWQIQILNNVYGRFGLQVKRGGKVDYVADAIYTCPAEGFMFSLLKDVTSQLWITLSDNHTKL